VSKQRMLAVSVAVLGLVACTPESTASADGGPDAGKGSADSGVALGGFTVKVTPPLVASDGGVTPGIATIDGKVYDSPYPALTQWDTKATVGDCSLVTPRTPFCSNGCGGSAVCVATETCQPYPTMQSVGTVAVTGVHTAAGGASFNLSSTAKNYYFYTPALAFPPFAEAEVVRLTTSGGVYAPVVLEAKGIAPLALTSRNPSLSASANLALTWTAATTGTSRISVLLDISHHGGSKGQILCDTADDGSLEVDQSLVSSLLALGATGFPWMVVTRRSTGVATIASGQLSLTVASDITENVEVPGLVSCSSSEDCPDGGACKVPEYTCE